MSTGNPTSSAAAPPLGLTAIWRGDDLGQLDWIKSLLGACVGEWVFDEDRIVFLDDVLVIDRLTGARDMRLYSPFRGKRAFLIDLSDENYDFDPNVYTNFRGVFRCHLSDVFHREFVRTLPLGLNDPFTRPSTADQPASGRQYIWSFLGQVDKASRPEMATHLAHVEPHLLFSTDSPGAFTMWNACSGVKRRYTPDECLAILADSVFAPCPMGNVNLECWRVYEALECGAIPIVERRLTLDYFKLLFGAQHPLPTVRSWAGARTLMSELMADGDRLNALQQKCRAWWTSYRLSLGSELQEFIQTRLAITTPVTVSDVVFPRFFRPGWQYAELLRHHSARAATRRIQRQLERMLGGRGLREAHGGHKLP